MSYLVKFSDTHGKTWEETFETEQQVLWMFVLILLMKYHKMVEEGH